MFDKMGVKIEAVNVGTPDFSTFSDYSLYGYCLGQFHVYVEKPMAKDFQWEVWNFDDGLSERHNVVTQWEIKGILGEFIFNSKHWKDAGYHQGVTGLLRTHETVRDVAWSLIQNDEIIHQGDLPKHFRWDTWLGTASPYGQNYNKIL